jgi:hypothetical protein
MSQIVTPEEMAALFEELRAVKAGSVSLHRGVPQAIMPRGRVFPEPNRITGRQNLSDWLMALADLRLPHL